MQKRVQTWFGVVIPPFKEPKFGAKSTTIRFVLTGKMPSKKNNLQAVTVRMPARSWAFEQEKKGKIASWADVHIAINMVYSKMRGNAEYLKFKEKCKPILQEQAIFWSNRLQKRGLIFPITRATMTLKLHFKHRYVTDSVNKQQTIQDVLVDCGIIANDDYKSLNPITSKAASYYEEIIQDIAFISLTINLQP